MATAEYYLRQEIGLKKDVDTYYRSLIGGYSSAYARTGKRTFLWLADTARTSRTVLWRPLIEELNRIRDEFRSRDLIWLTKTLYSFAVRQERVIAGIYELIAADLPERRSFLDRLSEFARRIRRIIAELFAQYPGVIFGHVIDKETRAPLVGAKLTINGFTIVVLDAIAGRYIFENFPGSYTITAEMEGYIPQTIKVALAPAGRIEVNFELEKLIKLEITIILRAKTPTEPHYYTISAKNMDELRDALEKAKESFRRRFGEVDTHDPAVADAWRAKGKEVVEKTDKAGRKFWVWKRWSDRKWSEVEKTIRIEFLSDEDEKKYDEWIKAQEKIV